MKILISNLTFKTIIGILPQERLKKQLVIVDVAFEYSYTKGAYIDYASVASLIKSTLQEQKFELIEDALLYLQNLLYSQYTIHNLQLKITKPTILKDCSVSVEIDYTTPISQKTEEI